MASPTLQRRDVIYSGHVQGVGFRYTTRSIARGYEVTGYVRNLPDGRVELVAVGTVAELDRFLSAIAEQMAGNIRSVDCVSVSNPYVSNPYNSNHRNSNHHTSKHCISSHQAASHGVTSRHVKRPGTAHPAPGLAMGESEAGEFAEFTIRY